MSQSTVCAQPGALFVDGDRRIALSLGLITTDLGIDQNGVVKDSWIGKLSDQEIKNVLERIAKLSNGCLRSI